jgi:hypothetical protein
MIKGIPGDERDAGMALLMDALLLMKDRDADKVETWHQRVGALVLRIDQSDARRKMEGTLR